MCLYVLHAFVGVCMFCMCLHVSMCVFLYGSVCVCKVVYDSVCACVMFVSDCMFCVFCRFCSVLFCGCGLYGL